ncbi:MAG: cytochrome c maturation protein CcmE [Chloroflexi bacterium]|nr:cytochrome c maturation protein CcmE [Chloroflexota bacterium]
MSGILNSRRARLVALLVISTGAISALAFSAAGDSVSYYITPEEFLRNERLLDQRVRVAGRVVEGSIRQEAGRPIAFTIAGDANDRVQVDYPKGVVPNLFGPYAMVVVEGTGRQDGLVHADSIIIKHEDEFYADQPPEGSISSKFVKPDATNPVPTGTPAR